jgi:cell division septum initiation protein DivIVA
MDILHLVDRLEELFNDSRSIPFTRNVIVDEDRMLEIIDQMRIAIPDEVKKAQQLLTQRDRIIAQAQEESGRIIQLAKEKAAEFAEKDNITVMAQHRSDQILDKAVIEAEQIRADADNYVIDALSGLELQLERLLNQSRNGLRMMQEEMMRKQMAGGHQPPAQSQSQTTPEPAPNITEQAE